MQSLFSHSSEDAYDERIAIVCAEEVRSGHGTSLRIGFVCDNTAIAKFHKGEAAACAQTFACLCSTRIHIVHLGIVCKHPDVSNKLYWRIHLVVVSSALHFLHFVLALGLVLGPLQSNSKRARIVRTPCAPLSLCTALETKEVRRGRIALSSFRAEAEVLFFSAMQCSAVMRFGIPQVQLLEFTR